MTARLIQYVIKRIGLSSTKTGDRSTALHGKPLKNCIRKDGAGRLSNLLAHHVRALAEDSGIKLMVNRIEYHPGFRQKERKTNFLLFFRSMIRDAERKAG